MESLSSSAYEALISFLYHAPVGLVQTTLTGEITMINPMSARLLLPLVGGGFLPNLFDALDAAAPQLRELAGRPAAAGSLLCDGLHVQVPATHGRGRPATNPAPAQVLSICLLKLDESSFMASVSDVTTSVHREQQRLENGLHDASRIDRLTSMPNRAAAVEHIERALELARVDSSRQFAVLFINVDRFDRINVTLGPSIGDELLRRIAERISSTLRGSDVLVAARLGGDEFVVLLESAGICAEVSSIALRLMETLRKPYGGAAATVHITASMGVLTSPHAGGSADAVLHDASLAMREARRAGGDCWRLFEPAMKASAQKRGCIEQEMRSALSEGQFFVVYQPIVDLASGQVSGVEALVRWRHPARGVVPPSEFIEIAEETGLIGALGELVLDQACRQVVRWQRTLGDQAPRMLSVNLSRAQLLGPMIEPQVRRALQSSGLAATCLQLEVTESLAAQNHDIQMQLRRLKALGLTLALDDFGTGYSSLASLHQLPIDVVKIDRSFVSQVESSPHHQVLIEAVVKVARSLGMGTVAEGIETEAQAAVLTRLHCVKGQGYLYAKPLPPDDATRWLMANANADRPGLRIGVERLVAAGLERLAAQT